MVLNIPSVDDMQALTRTYTSLVDISDALGLHRLDVLDTGLTTDDYAPNRHWNNSGHAKASTVVIACVSYMEDHRGSICPQATP